MRAAKDEEFRAYVHARRADLLRTATLLTAGDRHLAEDIVQSTLTRLYVSWSLFQKAAKPDAYARRALANALMDEHRRPWRRREHASSAVPDVVQAQADEDTARAEALNGALRELAPRMRAVVVYRYFHDMSVADTADALGCSQGTVKSQTARALDRLRGALDPPGERPPGSPSAAIPSWSAAAPTTPSNRSI